MSPAHPIKRVRQSFAGFSKAELNELSKTKAFARWIGRSESLLRNVENWVVPFSKNLALRVSECTGVDVEWLLSNPPDGQPIRACDGGTWDPRQLLDPLVLGDFDFRNTLPMAPQLLLRLALVLVEVGCQQALEQSDDSPLIRLMELIKLQRNLDDPAFLQAVEAKLSQPGYADTLQLWTAATWAAKERRDGRQNS